MEASIHHQVFMRGWKIPTPLSINRLRKLTGSNWNECGGVFDDIG